MLKGNFQLNLVAPPEVLRLKVGDTCTVRCAFNYSGPPVSGKLYVAIWHPTWYDPHDEVAHGEKSFSIPTSVDKTYQGDVDIYVKSGIAPGDYGLYVKIVGVPGPDIFSPYYENVIEIVEEVPVGISFQISIWGIPPDFGDYDKWCCYYWDPGINDFVGDGKWYYPYQKIGFSNVKSGGYLAVFLMRNSTVSSQYTSPTFDAVDGGVYQYDVQLGRVSRIG